MFDLRNLFKRNNKIKKPALIFIHGFGKRRTDEFLNLYENLKDEYDIIMPELYNQEFINDNIWYNWISKAEERLIQAKNQNREIILIGFSMGGVIASYLASKFQVKKLVLINPAFEYINFKTAKNAVKHQLKKKENNDLKYKELPSEFTQTFFDIVDNTKGSINKVMCPILFIVAKGDEVIPYNVSLKYYKRIIHEQKKCIIFADGQHRLLDDEKLSKITISIISDFIKDCY